MLEVCLVLKEISRNQIKGLVPSEEGPTQLAPQFLERKRLLNCLFLKSNNTNTNSNLTMVSFANLLIYSSFVNCPINVTYALLSSVLGLIRYLRLFDFFKDYF